MMIMRRRITETILPRIYARMYYAHPRARVMSFSAFGLRHAEGRRRSSHAWWMKAPT